MAYVEQFCVVSRTLQTDWTLNEYNHLMFPGAGTIINIITIISGASLGVLVGNRMPTRTRTLLTDVLGLVTLLGAASALIPLWSDRYNSALPQGWTLLVVLGSLLIGGLIGSALKLENKLDSLGENLRVRFKASSECYGLCYLTGLGSCGLCIASGYLSGRLDRYWIWFGRDFERLPN